MHHKFCIIDKKTLINGSYNWTYYAEYKNMENIVILNDIETTYAFNSEFNNIVQRLSLCETYKTIRPEEITEYANYDYYSEDTVLKSISFEKSGNYDLSRKVVEVAKTYVPAEKDKLLNKYLKHIDSKIQNYSFESISTFTKITTSNDLFNDYNIRINNAIAFYKQKKYMEAIEQLRIVEKNNNNNIELHYWISLCHYRKADISNMQKQIDKALEINRQYCPILNLQALCLYSNNKKEKAILIFDEIESLDNGFYKAPFNKALIYKELNNKDSSLIELEKTLRTINQHLKHNGGDIEAWSILGDCYSISNNQDKKQCYHKAKELFDNIEESKRDFNLVERFTNGLRQIS